MFDEHLSPNAEISPSLKVAVWLSLAAEVDLHALKSKTWNAEACKQLLAQCDGNREDEHCVRVMAIFSVDTSHRLTFFFAKMSTDSGTDLLFENLRTQGPPVQFFSLWPAPSSHLLVSSWGQQIMLRYDQ